MVKMEILCDFCGKKFKRVQSQISVNKNHFCSRKCYGEWISINRVEENSNNYKDGISFSKDYRIKKKKIYKEYNKDYREKNKVHYRKYDLKRKYGLDLEKYESILISQNNKCKICGLDISNYNAYLAIDHDHNCCPGEITCGKCIRGLLCRNCNQMLGNAKDSIDVLKNGVLYLETYKKGS